MSSILEAFCKVDFSVGRLHATEDGKSKSWRITRM